MKYYYNLPDRFSSFFKTPNDIQRYLPKKTGHHWGMHSLLDFMNPLGIEWFSDHKIYLKSFVLLFNCTENYAGPVHLDGASYAVNHVLSGRGTMQWFGDEKKKEVTKYKLTTGESYTFPTYTDDENMELLDSWTGTNGVLKVNVPHRLVTTDSSRSCVSFRFENGSFDGLVSILEKEWIA